MIDLEAIGEVVNARPSLVCMSDHDHLVSSIDQLLLNGSAIVGLRRYQTRQTVDS